MLYILMSYVSYDFVLSKKIISNFINKNKITIQKIKFKNTLHLTSNI